MRELQEWRVVPAELETPPGTLPSTPVLGPSPASAAAIAQPGGGGSPLPVHPPGAPDLGATSTPSGAPSWARRASPDARQHQPPGGPQQQPRPSVSSDPAARKAHFDDAINAAAEPVERAAHAAFQVPFLSEPDSFLASCWFPYSGQNPDGGTSPLSPTIARSEQAARAAGGAGAQPGAGGGGAASTQRSAAAGSTAGAVASGRGPLSGEAGGSVSQLVEAGAAQIAQQVDSFAYEMASSLAATTGAAAAAAAADGALQPQGMLQQGQARPASMQLPVATTIAGKEGAQGLSNGAQQQGMPQSPSGRQPLPPHAAHSAPAFPSPQRPPLPPLSPSQQRQHPSPSGGGGGAAATGADEPHLRVRVPTAHAAAPQPQRPMGHASFGGPYPLPGKPTSPDARFADTGATILRPKNTRKPYQGPYSTVGTSSTSPAGPIMSRTAGGSPLAPRRETPRAGDSPSGGRGGGQAAPQSSASPFARTQSEKGLEVAADAAAAAAASGGQQQASVGDAVAALMRPAAAPTKSGRDPVSGELPSGWAVEAPAAPPAAQPQQQGGAGPAAQQQQPQQQPGPQDGATDPSLLSGLAQRFSTLSSLSSLSQLWGGADAEQPPQGGAGAAAPSPAQGAAASPARPPQDGGAMAQAQAQQLQELQKAQQQQQQQQPPPSAAASALLSAPPPHAEDDDPHSSAGWATGLVNACSLQNAAASLLSSSNPASGEAIGGEDSPSARGLVGGSVVFIGARKTGPNPAPAEPLSPARSTEEALTAEQRLKEQEQLYERAVAAEKKYKIALRRRNAMIAMAEEEKAVAKAEASQPQLRRPLPSVTEAERERERAEREDQESRAAGAAARVEIELRRAEAEAEIAWNRYFEAVDRDTAEAAASGLAAGAAGAAAVAAGAGAAQAEVEAARQRDWRKESNEVPSRVHGKFGSGAAAVAAAARG